MRNVLRCCYHSIRQPVRDTRAEKIISDAEQTENQQLEAHCRERSFVPVPMIVAVDAA